jgi:hypothetical protein
MWYSINIGDYNTPECYKDNRNNSTFCIILAPQFLQRPRKNKAQVSIVGVSVLTHYKGIY